jgi:hypothetical protein
MAIEPSDIEAAAEKPAQYRDAAGNQIQNRSIKELVDGAKAVDELAAKRARTSAFQKFKFGSKG